MFKMGTKTFSNQSMIVIPRDENIYQGKEDEGAQSVYKLNLSRKVLVSYASTNIKVTTTSRLIDLASFISSVGGNLGLFVGFSFINMFFFLYEQIEKHI